MRVKGKREPSRRTSSTALAAPLADGPSGLAAPLRTLTLDERPRRRGPREGRATRTAAPRPPRRRRARDRASASARDRGHVHGSLHAVRGGDRLPRALLALPADDRPRLGLRARAPGRRAPPAGHRRAGRHPPRLASRARGTSRRSIEQIATPLSAIGLISLVALLWGASGMMASIRLGLEAAMKVDRGRPAVRAKLVDFVLVAAAGRPRDPHRRALGVRRVLQRARRPLHGVGRHRDAVGPAPPRRRAARRDRRHRAAALPLRSGTQAPPPRCARRARSSPPSASGARRRSSRSSSPTSRATTSSTGRSPA